VGLIAFVVLLFWGGAIVVALLAARAWADAIAESGRAGLGRQLAARASSILSSGVGLLTLSVLISNVSAFRQVWAFTGPAWLVCIALSFLPIGRVPVVGLDLTPVRIIGASMAVTVLFAIAIAIYFVVFLISGGPEIL
jgi:hypothetical protein